MMAAPAVGRVGVMARWEGDAQGRLEAAALELFAERGYERTTVSQIAQRARLTERSYYRYFLDKREVLFAGGLQLERHLTASIHDALCETQVTDPLAAVVAAVSSASATFRSRTFLRQRAGVIAANPALHERELVKLAGLSQALTGELVGEGTEADVAALAVGVGMTIMRVAIEGWMADDQADYADVVASVAAQVMALVATSRVLTA